MNGLSFVLTNAFFMLNVAWTLNINIEVYYLWITLIVLNIRQTVHSKNFIFVLQFYIGAFYQLA